MPNSMYSLDAGFPRFTGGESDKQKVGAIYDYLIQLQEALRYCLQNLGGDNFNDKELEIIGNTIREPVNMVLKGVDEEMARMSASINGFSLAVTNGKGSSTLQLKAGDTVLSSQNIRFEGVVTFTAESDGYAKVDGGYLRCVNIDAEKVVGWELYAEEPTHPEFTRINRYGIHLASFNEEGVYIGSIAVNGRIMRIEGYTEEGIDIGSVGFVTIGRSGKRLDLVGDVYVNGTKIG